MRPLRELQFDLLDVKASESAQVETGLPIRVAGEEEWTRVSAPGNFDPDRRDAFWAVKAHAPVANKHLGWLDGSLPSDRLV
jgi:hypothetical protein